MKHRLGYEAIVCVQRAELHAPSPAAAPSSASAHANPFVHLGVMVPKGSADVTVPTTCATRVLPRTRAPVWNQTFALPVMPHSDVFVLQLLDYRPSNLAARLNSAPSVSYPFAPRRSSDSSDSESAPAVVWEGEGEEVGGEQRKQVRVEATSNASSVPTFGATAPGTIPYGQLIGLCLLPAARILPDGSVSRHCLEIFPRPTEPSVGRLHIAAKIEKRMIPMLSEDDLKDPKIIGQFHSTKLLAAESRFLGIGELAAFLFEEGYSTSPRENWDRAVTMLAQQLAFRIFQTKSSNKDDTDQYIASLKDEENFQIAKQRVEKQGGLWDGL